MNLDNVYIVDIEADGLLDSVSKIHVVSFAYKVDNEWVIRSTNDYEKIKNFFSDPNRTIVGHNFIGYDSVALERVLGIEVKSKLVDTLGLSWAMYPWRNRHGLADWGEEFGVPKPKIDDWEGLTYEEYKHRCEEDVKINTNLWVKMYKKLNDLYPGDKTTRDKYVGYINFKMKLLSHQEANKLNIDVELLKNNIAYFEKLKQEKIDNLIPSMPKLPKYSVKNRPKTLFKKDGSLSKKGEEWMEMVDKLKLYKDYPGPIKVVVEYLDPNPQSQSQIKDWLFSLGWEPAVFKPSNSTNPEKQDENVPQVRVNGMLCSSVLKLIEKEPAIEELEGLSVIVHRLGVLNSFIKALDKDNRVVASAGGLTNTLRFQHRAPICNLPGVMKKDKDGNRVLKDGRYIREVIVSEKGYKFFGADLSSLEDRVKQHFIYNLDPEFVQSMMVEGFDPHLDLAVFSGELTQEQADKHKSGEENYSDIRSVYKSANYACQYGVGKKTLAKSTGKSEKEAGKIIDTYWERNWAVQKFAEAQEVVHVDGKDWIVNPLNGFKYWLKTEKDKFSTLCQGGGTYIFDTWTYLSIKEGVNISLNVHDEYAGQVASGDEEHIINVCKKSIQKVNKMLNLLRDMDCDIQFGLSYSEVH